MTYGSQEQSCAFVIGPQTVKVLQKGLAKVSVAKKSKSGVPRHGLELYLNGGTTPAEVIQVESWDSEKTKCLRDLAKLEGAMRFTKVNIKSHTDKSQAWTTSRLPYFMQVVADSIFECIDAHV